MNEPQQSMIVLSREQVRAVDRMAIEEYGIAGIVLMENAGRGIADRICDLGIDGPVVIMCGPGNNGGDGHVVARHLAIRGFQVTTILAVAAERIAGDAATNLRINQRLGIGQVEATGMGAETKTLLRDLVQKADLVVDALLGTGATGAPRSVIAELIAVANGGPGQRLAIDIPSGMDCDTGEAPGAVFCADYTATLAALKPALTNASAECVGVVTVHDIGIPSSIVRRVQT